MRAWADRWVVKLADYGTAELDASSMSAPLENRSQVSPTPHPPSLNTLSVRVAPLLARRRARARSLSLCVCVCSMNQYVDSLCVCYDVSYIMYDV